MFNILHVHATICLNIQTMYMCTIYIFPVNIHCNIDLVKPVYLHLKEYLI